MKILSFGLCVGLICSGQTFADEAEKNTPFLAPQAKLKYEGEITSGDVCLGTTGLLIAAFAQAYAVKGKMIQSLGAKAGTSAANCISLGGLATFLAPLRNIRFSFEPGKAKAEIRVAPLVREKFDLSQKLSDKRISENARKAKEQRAKDYRASDVYRDLVSRFGKAKAEKVADEILAFDGKGSVKSFIKGLVLETAGERNIDRIADDIIMVKKAVDSRQAEFESTGGGTH